MAEPFVGRKAELAALAHLDRRVAEEGRPGADLVDACIAEAERAGAADRGGPRDPLQADHCPGCRSS